MAENNGPQISVVIPARNAAAELGLCLEAIFSSKKSSKGGGFEVIVVDDASDDATSMVAGKYPCELLRLPSQRGPACARNKGVGMAKGSIILFIDSDIIVNDNTISSISDVFSKDASVSAVVGMLDEKAFHKNLPSQFFNLRKHYDYLLINGNLSTLYTSVTAVKKDVFLEAGGFDERYTGASGEDAELGRRLFRLGHKISLDKKIRVAHLKYHTLGSLLASDYSRASHFIKFLIRERLAGAIVKEKRFGSFRIGSLATVSISPLLISALLLLPFFGRAFFSRASAAAFFIIVSIFIISNLGFLKFAAKTIGWKKNLIMPALMLIDSLAIFGGIVCGFAGFFLRGKKF